MLMIEDELISENPEFDSACRRANAHPVFHSLYKPLL